MRRIALLLACVLLGAMLAAGARAATPPTSCRTAEIQQHDEAVFGHFPSRAAASALALRLRKVQFKGVKIEDDGCGDFEVEIDGADKRADRASFANEAAKAGFQVTFEQTGPPMQPKSGEVVGVFGARRSLSAANALVLNLAGRGFRYIDIARTGSTWSVVMPQVPVRAALSIAAEVHKAGFRIVFSPTR
jgi:hypothetical protein